eukprot:TRINITY_DN11037_c0_g1_i1.p1 TRINITY_DN11037_c0_g1~~TRINITY_DN11037_c0_g1_i1.p1  ORF type:complete len:530 (+),score=25.00 TRINITY_DN11037_c0_g1_i1:163-1590(+)
MADDNRTYERAAIKRWLAEKKTSPVTGLRLRNSVLRTNWAIRDALSESGHHVAEGVRDEEDAGVAASSSIPPSPSSARLDDLFAELFDDRPTRDEEDAGVAASSSIPPSPSSARLDDLFAELFDDRPTQGMPPTPTGLRGLSTPTFSPGTPTVFGGLSTPTGIPGTPTLEGLSALRGFGGLSTPTGAPGTPTLEGLSALRGFGRLSPPRALGMLMGFGRLSTPTRFPSDPTSRCTCTTSPYSCRARQHQCVCSTGDIFQIPSRCRSVDHECTCSLGSAWRCKSIDHDCVCATMNSGELACRARSQHSCICGLGRFNALFCKAQGDHVCICQTLGRFDPSDCKASSHKCLCQQIAPARRESECGAGWYEHCCTCLTVGPRHCWAWGNHNCSCGDGQPWWNRCKADVHQWQAGHRSEPEAQSSSGSSNLSSGWKRMESRRQLGIFYYFHEESGESRAEPPPPWELRQSRSNPSLKYY